MPDEWVALAPHLRVQVDAELQRIGARDSMEILRLRDVTPQSVELMVGYAKMRALELRLVFVVYYDAPELVDGMMQMCAIVHH